MTTTFKNYIATLLAMMNQACVLQYVNVVMYMMMTKMGDVSDIGRHVRPTYSMSKEPIAHELVFSSVSMSEHLLTLHCMGQHEKSC